MRYLLALLIVLSGCQHLTQQDREMLFQAAQLAIELAPELVDQIREARVANDEAKLQQAQRRIDIAIETLQEYQRVTGKDVPAKELKEALDE
jgi:aminoglycoside N3'-acetyltransferase